MRRKFLCIFVTLSVPFLLYLNVWQAYRYTSTLFEVNGLITRQSNLGNEGHYLLNRVAELESPARIGELGEIELGLVPLEYTDVVRIEVLKSGN